MTATAASNFSFVNWTENGSVVSTSASYQFTVAADRSLVANFVHVDYTVTTSSNPAAGGTTSGGGAYGAGSQVTVVATPASCYAFANWTENGSVVSTTASYQFTVNGNRALVANFTGPASYTVTTSSSPAAGGTTSGGGAATCGTLRTVTATAASGYSFVNWTENGSVASTSASYQFTVSGNRSLVANFLAQSISVSPNLIILAPGGMATLSASPSPTSVLSRSPGVASVSGVTVTGVGTGVTDVVASLGGSSDSARVAVVPSDGFAVIVATNSTTAFTGGTPGGSVTLSVWILRPGGTAISDHCRGQCSGIPRACRCGLKWGYSKWSWIANIHKHCHGSLGFAALPASGCGRQELELAQLTSMIDGAAAGATATLSPSVSGPGPVRAPPSLRRSSPSSRPFASTSRVCIQQELTMRMILAVCSVIATACTEGSATGPDGNLPITPPPQSQEVIATVEGECTMGRNASCGWSSAQLAARWAPTRAASGSTRREFTSSRSQIPPTPLTLSILP